MAEETRTTIVVLRSVREMKDGEVCSSNEIRRCQSVLGDEWNEAVALVKVIENFPQLE